MREQIQEKLSMIEEKHSINILMAVEAGSRIWGFESLDSDYDIRFIYTRRLDDYLNIYNHKDTIEELDGLIDIVGWDLRKALALSIKSNASIYEWVNSPIKYVLSNSYDKLKILVNSHVNLYTHIKHNANLCIAQYKRFVEPFEEVRYKKYVYAIRPILNIAYMFEYGQVAPVSMIDTLYGLKKRGVLSIPEVIGIEQVIKDKKEKNEYETGPRNTMLDVLIESFLKDANQYEEDRKSNREEYTIEANSVF